MFLDISSGLVFISYLAVACLALHSSLPTFFPSTSQHLSGTGVVGKALQRETQASDPCCSARQRAAHLTSLSLAPAPVRGNLGIFLGLLQAITEAGAWPRPYLPLPCVCPF